MGADKEKFATQLDAELLATLRSVAKAEGRQIQAIVEEALKAHLADRSRSGPQGREHVMAAYLKSTNRYAGLYDKLSK